jgi:predicted N-acetyltransferase YhbS
MNVTIRPERADDYDEILRMTYDAFLTLDYPGRRRMDEHFLILLLQDCDKTIPELRFVAEHDGEIVGHIFYAMTAFRRPDGTHAETVTFAPLTVEPKHHRQGIGKALVSHTLEIARKMGFGAVVITGVPEYYPKLGFKRAREYGLTMEDGSSPDSLMVYELKPGYLSGSEYLLDLVGSDYGNQTH